MGDPHGSGGTAGCRPPAPDPGVITDAVKRSVVRADQADPEALKRAIRKLAKGQVVALPAGGRYLLVAHAELATAREALRRRIGDEGLARAIRLLPGFAAVEHLSAGWPRAARRLAGALWPGSLVLGIRLEGTDAQRLMVPADPWLRALAAESGLPLLAVRAARERESPAPLNAAGVLAAIDPPPDLILDAGRQPGGPGWSEVRCADRHFTVMEPGTIPRARLVRAAAPLVLVVCTGNICRSPLAEALLRKELAARLRCPPDQLVRYGFRVASCGTATQDGLPASDHAIRVGNELGVDLSLHRSRAFREVWAREARCIYGLAQHHLHTLVRQNPEREPRVQMLDPEGADIEDPYGRSLSVYRRVGEHIVAACARRAAELIEEEHGRAGSGGDAR